MKRATYLSQQSPKYTIIVPTGKIMNRACYHCDLMSNTLLLDNNVEITRLFHAINSIATGQIFR